LKEAEALVRMGLRLAHEDKEGADQSQTVASAVVDKGRNNDSLLSKVWDRMGVTNGGVRIQDRASEAVEELKSAQEDYMAAKSSLEVSGSLAHWWGTKVLRAG